MEMFEGRNVYGQELEPCCFEPRTGFYRDGHCNTSHADQGMHTVCIEATADFLEYSKSMGNDLSTPNKDYQFPGVKPGDRWCLCAPRWVEAYRAGKAPKVYLKATHEETLAIIPLSLLEQFSAD